MNQARTDHLQLQHWVKVHLDATGKVKEDSEHYYFAKYNVKVQTPPCERGGALIPCVKCTVKVRSLPVKDAEVLLFCKVQCRSTNPSP